MVQVALRSLKDELQRQIEYTLRQSPYFHAGPLGVFFNKPSLVPELQQMLETTLDYWSSAERHQSAQAA